MPLSVCRCLLLSVCLYSYASVCVYELCVCLSVRMLVVCLLIGLYAYVCLSLGQSVCGHSVYLFACLCLSISVCLFVCLSVSVSVSVCVYLSVRCRSVGRRSFSAVSQSQSARSVQATEGRMLKARERKATHTRAKGYAHKSDRPGGNVLSVSSHP